MLVFNMHGWRYLNIEVRFEVEDMHNERVAFIIDSIHSHDTNFLSILLILKKVWWFIRVVIYVKTHETNIVFFGANHINWGSFKPSIDS